MKTLTIIQPWATLVVSGRKKNETRSWKTNYRGEILIHAGRKRIDYAEEIFMNPYFIEAGIARRKILDLMPRGLIIGKANLVDCIRIDEKYQEEIKNTNPSEFAFGDYSIGRYAWVMENPIIFEEHIPASGKQGLWNWEL